MVPGLLGSIFEALPSLTTAGVQVYNAVTQKAARTETKSVARKVVKSSSGRGGIQPSALTVGIPDFGQYKGVPTLPRASRSPLAATNGATGDWTDIAQYLGRQAFRGIGGALVERLTKRIEHPRGALVKARTPAPRLSNGMPFAPPGYRVHYEDEADEFFVTKVRHPNWLNLKALWRAERRTDMFSKIVKRYLRCSHKAHISCGAGGGGWKWKKKAKKK